MVATLKKGEEEKGPKKKKKKNNAIKSNSDLKRIELFTISFSNTRNKHHFKKKKN